MHNVPQAEDGYRVTTHSHRWWSVAGFFATLETELFWAQPKRRFDSHRDAKLAIFDYIEVFYNRRRRHTAIGNVPPVTFEAAHFTPRPELAA